MRKLALIYGMRLLPAEEIESTQDAPVILKEGRSASVTMHLIEGSTELEIRQQLERSIDAFFEFYPEL